MDGECPGLSLFGFIANHSSHGGVCPLMVESESGAFSPNGDLLPHSAAPISQE